MNTLKHRRSQWGRSEREQEYWLSYSDLLAGLLMVFALMLFVALHHYSGIIRDVGDIAATRTRIIEILNEMVEENNLGVDVDPITGAVRFPDGVLFDQARWELRPEGRAQLAQFADRYFSALLDDPEIRAEIRAVVIEGHTNDDGPYMYNLELSQRRAFSVMSYLLSSTPAYNEELKRLVTASGRSFSDLIRCKEQQTYDYPCPLGTTDRVRSRRIEVHFRLRDEELLDKIRRRLLFQS